MHQSDQGFRLNGVKFFFFEDLCNEFAGVAMAVFHGVDQRQSDFAFFEIAEHRLAELLGGGGEIEQVVHQLKRQAGVAAVVGEGFFFGAFESAKDRAESRAAAEQARGLVRRETAERHLR